MFYYSSFDDTLTVFDFQRDYIVGIFDLPAHLHIFTPLFGFIKGLDLLNML